jgi:hypothetical protein
MKRLLWGCPGMNFKVTLPFAIMRGAYAAFEKRPPWPLQPYFEAVKCYKESETYLNIFTKASIQP